MVSGLWNEYIAPDFRKIKANRSSASAPLLMVPLALMAAGALNFSTRHTEECTSSNLNASLYAARTMNATLPEDNPYRQNVKALAQQGIHVNEAMIALMARASYFEGAFDPAADSIARAEGTDVLDEIAKNYGVFAQVIYNRWEFDNEMERQGRGRPFGNGSANPYDIVFRTRNQGGCVQWEFPGIGNSPGYFRLVSPNGTPIVGEEGIKLAVDGMSEERTQASYNALATVFGTNLEPISYSRDGTPPPDITNDATHMYNHELPQKEMEARGLVPTGVKINSFHLYKLDGDKYLTILDPAFK